MKKIRLGSIILLIISTVIFVGFRIYEYSQSDNEAPVISYGEEELVVSVEADESKLLKDVKAEDKKSGDVSDALVVEKLSDFTEEGVRIITYAAIDAKGNVARKERTLKYTDYQAPEFKLSEPLRYPMGKKIDVLDKITASSVLDGDLTSNIKYSLETTINVMNPGMYPIEFRVMDSGGKTTYLNTQLEVYDATKERNKLN